MSIEDIILLRYIASEETVSVSYFPAGKIYLVPVAAFLLDKSYDPLDDINDSIGVYIDCSYAIKMGMPFMHCKIWFNNPENVIESSYVPLDPKLRDTRQRIIMSLINTCSKRVIAQEISRNRYAIYSAYQSMNNDNQHS